MVSVQPLVSWSQDVTLRTSGYVRATRAHGNRGWDRTAFGTPVFPEMEKLGEKSRAKNLSLKTSEDISYPNISEYILNYIEFIIIIFQFFAMNVVFQLFMGTIFWYLLLSLQMCSQFQAPRGDWHHCRFVTTLTRLGVDAEIGWLTTFHIYCIYILFCHFFLRIYFSFVPFHAYTYIS